MVIKNRRISGCVTVMGPPAAICFLKMGITLPFDPSTFPKRTATYFVQPFCKPRRTSSAIRLGATVLSLEVSFNPDAPKSFPSSAGAPDLSFPFVLLRLRSALY